MLELLDAVDVRSGGQILGTLSAPGVAINTTRVIEHNLEWLQWRLTRNLYHRIWIFSEMFVRPLHKVTLNTHLCWVVWAECCYATNCGIYWARVGGGAWFCENKQSSESNRGRSLSSSLAVFIIHPQCIDTCNCPWILHMAMQSAHVEVACRDRGRARILLKLAKLPQWSRQMREASYETNREESLHSTCICSHFPECFHTFLRGFFSNTDRHQFLACLDGRD